MSNCKILYVCEQITPYVPENGMSSLCRTLCQGMQEKGCEIRTFMPRYGCINERRNQLHEVIRLSGMNLIIDNNDHQLIIKVASIPAARVQIYFIDNDDYFSRKAMLADQDGNLFPDNDERATFFARGVLETVKKLRWEPGIVHCHGWFSAVVPLYLRYVMADEPMFQNTKIVVSLYEGDRFSGSLDGAFAEKLAGEGIDPAELELIGDPTYENLMKLIIRLSDGVVLETSDPGAELRQWITDERKPVLEYQDKSTTEYLDNYRKFYEELL